MTVAVAPMRLFAVAFAAALSMATAADAAPAPKKKPYVTKKGIGFLPGYRTPETLRRIEHRPRYWYYGGRYYFGRPGFAGGRWNGGSYGPCWTSTPIGLQWNCGE
jgi:hypothetical protein